MLRGLTVDPYVSQERVVEIEYVERFPPPEPEDSLAHDDWVSAVVATADL